MASIAHISSFSISSNSPALISATLFKRVSSVKCLAQPPDSDSGNGSNFTRSVSTYKWCAGIGALGLVESGYLTYLKLTGSESFCPVGGGTCDDVLNSDYAVVFGIPLPIYGMIAYGLVGCLGLYLSQRKAVLGLGEDDSQSFFLGITTSMATASVYFLYILKTELAGASCGYCFFSAFLSFTLFFLTVADIGFSTIQSIIGQELIIVAMVIAALTTSYSFSKPESASLDDINLQPYQVEITTPSSPAALALAKHLKSIGAKMYGAFWCSHCLEQKQMFGREASKILDYIECFPDGVRKGIKMSKICEIDGLDGFPTWVINGQLLSGETKLEDLAKASGFVLEDFNPS